MDVIRKRAVSSGAAPVLEDYAAERARFDWSEARCRLDGLPGGRGLNIAHEAVDRHAAGPRAPKTAIRWLGKAGDAREIRYGELGELTSRFANVLEGLAARRGMNWSCHVALWAGSCGRSFPTCGGARCCARGARHDAVRTARLRATGAGDGRAGVTATDPASCVAGRSFEPEAVWR